MVLTHLAFTLLMLAFPEDIEANKTGLKMNPILDPKKRNEAVDEAFLEQKDILLDMLEIKLKEVRDKKKKKAEQGESKSRDGNRNDIQELRNDKCDSMLRNVDVKVKINGISAMGDAKVNLKYGTSGKGFINLNASGISNIGQANVEMGIGESAVFIPGISNLFVERHLMDCSKISPPQRAPSAHSEQQHPSSHSEKQHQNHHPEQQHSNSHVQQPNSNSHIQPPHPNSLINQPPLNSNFYQPSQNTQFRQTPPVLQVQENNSSVHIPPIVAVTSDPHPVVGLVALPVPAKPEVRLDQTRRNEDNNDTIVVEANVENTSLSSTDTVTLTTATAFSYTSPTTSTPHSSTTPMAILTSSTPYFVRRDKGDTVSTQDVKLSTTNFNAV